MVGPITHHNEIHAVEFRRPVLLKTERKDLERALKQKNTDECYFAVEENIRVDLCLGVVLGTCVMWGNTTPNKYHRFSACTFPNTV